MRKYLDLCADIGESFGSWRKGDDAALLQCISSANVACGFHAGDPHVMRQAVVLAREKGVRVGAHPGLPDLMGFGRRQMDVSPSELKDFITYQIGALKAFVEAEGMKLQHVIQHGALTAMAENDEKLAEAIMDSVLEVDPELCYLAFEGSDIPEKALHKGLNVKMLAFADRAYNRNKRLVSRKVPGATIHDPERIAERIERLLMKGEIVTIDGGIVPLAFDSIILHGDSPGALEIAKTVKATVISLGVSIRAMSEADEELG